MNRVFLAVIRSLPRPFRERFGDEILEQIEHDAQRARERGAIAAFAFSLGAVLDLVRTSVAERVRPTWTQSLQRDDRMSTMHEWSRDIRQAARALKRTPAFTVVAVGTLGLAIGVNAGMFSVVDAVLLEPLPFANVGRLVNISATAPGSGFPDEFGVAAEFFVQYKEQSKLLEDISVYNSFTSTLRVGDRVERIRMSAPTNSLYSTLGAKPILGRLPVSADDDRAVVISYKLWQQWFGSDPNVVGKAYVVSSASRTIVGVMGPEFQMPLDGTLLWISNEVLPQGISPGRFGTNLVARVKPGVTNEQLATELTALSKKLPDRFGGSANYRKLIAQHHAVVRSLTDQIVGPVKVPLYVLLGAVGVVLLIACANVANLFMVRAEARQRDLAVRMAIGAARGQLIQSMMSEAVVVAAAAGVLAMFFATLTLPIFLRFAPPNVPRIAATSMNATTLSFTLAAAIVSALICGLIPAIRASRPDLKRLRDGGRGATRTRNLARDGLVVGQTALALVLLIGSALLVRSFWSLRHVNPGYSTENLFTFQIAPEGPTLRGGLDYARFDLAFLDKLAALPGVESAGLVENIPLNEATATNSFRPEDGAADADGGARLNYTYTAGDYFKTMSIAQLRGRAFTSDDHLDAQPNVVLSRGAAELLWPGKDPIGRRLQRISDTLWYTVVGVVDDVMQDDFRHKPNPLVYFPLVGPTPRSWVIDSPAYVIRTSRAETIAPDVRALVRQVAPNAPMYRVFTMAGLAKDSMIQLSFTMLTLGIVSTLALVLGAVGLYGVLSYIVTMRTREIGVRMALGAEASAVRRMVVVQGARVVAIGIAIGVVGALASTRALSSLLYEVKAADATTFAGTSLSMILIGFLASYLPARRASKVDPVESLRGD